MTVTTDPRPINDSVFSAMLAAPADVSCADWADTHFVLSAESSNTSGQWVTTTPQRAILNSFGNDAIEKVDFFKCSRFGGTKMLVIANAYFLAHKKRSVAFYQPTRDDSDSATKTEIEPAIRDCEPWRNALVDSREGSSKNTQSFKSFLGANAYYRGGHSANSFRRLTVDVIEIDELDGFNADIGGEGDATVLSWGRLRNAVHKKQIQVSTPTIAGLSLIEKAARAAQDCMEFHVKCPECGEHGPLRWGGKDADHGFKWEGRDASTVKHFGSCCGVGWGNEKAGPAIEAGFWQGEKGFKTYDGLEWFFNDEPCDAPRHISWFAWSALSPFNSWEQIVTEYFDALADQKKLQAFTNTVLGQVWNADGDLAVTEELVDSMLPTADPEQLAQIVAVTVGLDVQDLRLEAQWLAHATDKSIYPLAYEVYHGNTDEADPYNAFLDDYRTKEFNIGDKTLKAMGAAIDTQGHRNDRVHEWLHFCRTKRIPNIIGINGHGKMWSRIADKPSVSTAKAKGNKEFYSIGVNTLKRDVYDMLQRFDEPERAFRFVDGVQLPLDYNAQLVAERMVNKTIDGKQRMVFENTAGKRNEALDVTVYGLAVKAYFQKYGNNQIKRIWANL